MAAHVRLLSAILTGLAKYKNKYKNMSQKNPPQLRRGEGEKGQ
jgi:hypothetical protein